MDTAQILLADYQLFRIRRMPFRADVQQRAVAFLVVQRFVERHIAVQRNMLLARRGFDGSDNLARDAQFGKGAEGRKFLRPEVANRLVEPNHAFLHDVLVIRADEKVAARLGTDEVLVLVQQIFHRHRVPRAAQRHHVLVRHALIDRMGGTAAQQRHGSRLFRFAGHSLSQRKIQQKCIVFRQHRLFLLHRVIVLIHCIHSIV